MNNPNLAKERQEIKQKLKQIILFIEHMIKETEKQQEKIILPWYSFLILFLSYYFSYQLGKRMEISFWVNILLASLAGLVSFLIAVCFIIYYTTNGKAWRKLNLKNLKLERKQQEFIKMLTKIEKGVSLSWSELEQIKPYFTGITHCGIDLNK